MAQYGSNQDTLIFFKEKLKELLEKRISGIHIRQAQYELETYSQEQFPTERLEYCKFFEFLYDCRDFIEVRSLKTVCGKDMYVFIDNRTLSKAKIKLRIATNKTDAEPLRCETVSEPITQVCFSLPRFFRTKAFVPGRVQQVESPTISHHPNYCICGDIENSVLSESEIGRIKRTSVLDSGTAPAQSPTQQFQMHNHEFEERSQSKQQLLPPQKVSSFKGGYVAQFLPEVIFPNGQFDIELLGCDEKSYLYIRIDNEMMMEKYETMKQRLSLVTFDGLQPISLAVVEEGDALLAYNVHSSKFFRALVMKKHPEDGLSLYDVDTAGQLHKVVTESMYMLPADLMALPPKAIKVALEKHVDYLETDAVYTVFDHPSIQIYYSCEYVQTLVKSKIMTPIVKLIGEDGSLVNFRRLIN